MSSEIRNSKPFQPIDRVALTLMLVLSLLISILLWGGDRTRPYVREFSWQDKPVGAADTFFLLTFSRPMNHASVEVNLQIHPPLPGLISWTGRRLVYTLNQPAPYATTYQVALQKAQQSLGMGKSGNLMQPFEGQFRTRDRVFVYLGVTGDEKGRLILYNLTRQQKIILTPKNMVVTDFKSYPTGDRILFTASDWSDYGPGLFEQQLYSVTTGISAITANSPHLPLKAGNIERILDNSNYHNLKFDLSPDGQVIVVFRVNRHNPDDSGLWVKQPNTPWQLFLKQLGGDFAIAPDSQTIAHMPGEGVAILPLMTHAKPLDFFPKFDKVLGFSKDGIRAAMVKSNSDSTQSLFLVTNQGLQKELLSTNGDLLNCQFDAMAQNLYCLMTQLLPGEQYSQQLSLAAIDLKTYKVELLWDAPNQSQMQVSLSPDGLALLFDQVVQKETLASKDDLTTDTGSAIANSRLMLLPLSHSTSKAINNSVLPQELPVQGFHPHWLP